MTFDQYWEQEWKANAMPGAFNAAMREIALKAWNAAIDSTSPGDPIAWLDTITNGVTLRSEMGPYFGGMSGAHITPLVEQQYNEPDS